MRAWAILCQPHGETMFNDEVEFRRLMERVLLGDEAAASELLRIYGPAVQSAVRRNLNKQIRSKFDSIDFVQDVWKSFFANPPGQDAFLDPKRLVAFLTRMARNKVIDETRRRMAGQKFNVNREHSLDNSSVGGPDQVPAKQPTPSEVCTGREEWDRLLAGQPAVYRHILMLLRDGKKPQEIADDLSISKRTVHRAIANLQSKLTS